MLSLKPVAEFTLGWRHKYSVALERFSFSPFFIFLFFLRDHFYHCLKVIGDSNPGPWSILKPPAIHSLLSGQRLVPVGSCLVFSLLALSVYEPSGSGTKLGCLRSWTSLLSHFSSISKWVVWTAAICVTIVQLFDWDAKYFWLFNVECLWPECCDFINLQSSPVHLHQLKCSAHTY